MDLYTVQMTYMGSRNSREHNLLRNYIVNALRVLYKEYTRQGEDVLLMYNAHLDGDLMDVEEIIGDDTLNFVDLHKINSRCDSALHVGASILGSL